MDDERAAPVLDATRAADGVVEALSADELRGAWPLRALKTVLRWALSKAPPDPDGAWLRDASERRLATANIRATSWVAVLDEAPRTDAARRAADLVVAALAFRRELQAASCSPRLREQCGTIFSTTLLPQLDGFRLHRGDGRHVLVGVAGMLHAVDVLDEDGAARDGDEIAADFRRCLSDAGKGAPVLALTSVDRAKSAPVWAELERASPEATRLVADALFSVFFEPSSPAGVDAVGARAQADAPENRCHWHALQLVVFRNARAVVVGNYSAQMEGECAHELLSRIANAGRRDARPKRSPATAAACVPLEWTVDSEKLDPVIELARQRVVDAGGSLVVPEYGRARWLQRGTSPEAAVVVAIRLALALAQVSVESLDCMINMAHYRHGFATRISIGTAELDRFVARMSGDASTEERAAALKDAMAAHQALVRRAKTLRSGEQSLQYAIEALRGVSSFVRWVLRVATAWVVVLTKRAAPSAAAAGLIVIDSSVRPVAGVRAIGRFGIAAFGGALWMHHSIREDDIVFVLQGSPKHLAATKRLRTTLPAALEQVMSLSAADGEAAREASPHVPSKIALGRLHALLAVLQSRRHRL